MTRLCFLFAFFLAAPAAAQQDFSKVEIQAQKLSDSVYMLVGAEGTRIIPGHGPLATRADLRAYRDMLSSVSGRIREQLRAGRSLPEVIESRPTAEFDAVWGKGFLNSQRFVEMLYKNLQQAK